MAGPRRAAVAPRRYRLSSADRWGAARAGVEALPGRPPRHVLAMSIFWTAPAALVGLALIALPIAVHLLARQNIRTLPYPSLRFLRQTQLASFRRRAVQDAALLLCRAAIVAIAAPALAGPVFQTPARQAAYANRVA